jgi:hypothetical protein
MLPLAFDQISPEQIQSEKLCEHSKCLTFYEHLTLIQAAIKKDVVVD